MAAGDTPGVHFLDSTNGGEAGRLIRERSWGATSLGARDSWPLSLKSYLSMVLELPTAAIIFWGPDQVQLYNDGYAVIMGPRHPRHLGSTFRECWPEAYETIHPWMQRVLLNGETVEVIRTLVPLTRYGFVEEAYFTFSFSPLRDDEERIAGVLQIVTEVTATVLGERRTATLQQLSRQTALARTSEAAVRLATDVLAGCAADLPFSLIYVVDALDPLSLVLAGSTGLAEGPQPFPGRIDLRSEGALPELARVVGEGETLPIEDPSKRLGVPLVGAWTEPPRLAVASPIVGADQKDVIAVLVAGVSPRLELDSPYQGFLALTSAHLGSMMAAARAYDDQRKRAEAQAAIDRAKTEFFSNVSHEFRTPLTLILGPVEDALRTPAKAIGGDALEGVQRNALRLLKLVNSLLDFSRIEADRLRSAFEPTDLPALTAGVAGSFRSLAESAGLTLVVDCPAMAEPVYVDPTEWEKIVLNLISNAFKFTFEGKIAVGLRADGDQVRLEVSDTGVGIPASELPRIFERFHRVEGARGRSFEGTGIGLALVQELVKQHGGTVHATSILGQGSRFAVTIPRGKDHLPQDHIVDASTRTNGAQAYLLEASQWQISPQDGGPRADRHLPCPAPEVGAPGAGRILIADDNADMRDYLTRLLAPHFRVEAVEDGQAALESALRAPPDLVLSDVMMPRMDGAALLRALRGDPRTKTIPVVLLSARAGEEAVVAGLETGADDYLSKPFSANELLARVRTHIEMSRMRRAWTRELEQLNQQLKVALQDSQAAREEALAASHAKSEFLAAMSHEIRTPLNAILGFSGLLADLPLTSRQREFAVSIRTSGDHLLGVINDILDFSKLQSGRFELAPAPFALRPTLEAALDFVAARAAEKGLDLAYVMEPETPAGLEADEARVRQILINYLSNAVKFTTRGEIVLRVRARPLDPDGTHEFHFTVRDTGMGIPPDRMDRLFREFSQADASIGSRFGGTGLGLAICRRLAELQGGRVWGESEVGVGSAFHLAIPALARPDVAASGGPARDSLRGLRTLIVDDNATNIDILRAQTESWGMRVRATQSPAEALGWVEAGQSFDLVITDQEMPIIDGIELATRIRRLPRGATVPIVLLTSLSSGGQLRQVPGGSLAAVLTKPIRQSELFNRIRAVLVPAVPASPPPAAQQALAVSPLSILLVEDNIMNQKVALVLLERIGYGADLVSDGQQAIEAVGSKGYDVVLMDVQMPKVGGMEATRAIRAHGRAIRQPRIIAMTANAMRGDREACLAAGMDDYVSKPIDRSELVLALQRAALAAHPTDAPGAPRGPSAPEIDADTFASQLRDIGQADLAGLIDLFASTAPQTAAHLRKAAEAKDPGGVSSAAHQLKSMATTLGARSLGQLLDELEAAGRTGAVDGRLADVVLVEARLRALLAELAAARPKGK